MPSIEDSAPVAGARQHTAGAVNAHSNFCAIGLLNSSADAVVDPGLIIWLRRPVARRDTGLQFHFERLRRVREEYRLQGPPMHRIDEHRDAAIAKKLARDRRRELERHWHAASETGRAIHLGATIFGSARLHAR
jgi:hypothetical protein